MPTTDQHVKRAQENEEFYRRRLDLREAIDRSWAVAALFYAALHWVDAYLGTIGPTGHHPSEHLVRDRLVGREQNLRAVSLHYKQLEDRSRDARYQLKAFTAAEVRDLETQHFIPLRDHIAGLLGQRRSP